MMQDEVRDAVLRLERSAADRMWTDQDVGQIAGLLAAEPDQVRLCLGGDLMAAFELQDKALPGSSYLLGTAENPQYHCAGLRAQGQVFYGTATTPALAFLAALLRATGADQ